VNRITISLQSILFFLISQHALAQKSPSVYNSNLLFDPGFFTQTGNDFRSASGAPGPRYWQNTANYNIHVTLNDADSSLKGTVNIRYTNKSPDSLHYLWLQLDQNLFDTSSRGAATTEISGDRYDMKGYTKGGYQIESVSVMYQGKTFSMNPVITDTRMQLRLPFSLNPREGKIEITIHYSFSIPQYGADRMGRLFTKNGVIYQLAQWYPRMCVYDDVEGWNTLPYIGTGEFYCEYGDFDYFITAPADMKVVGSGDLQNSGEVLVPKLLSRLDRARKSDSTVHIIGEEEINDPSLRPAQKKELTWHFKMLNTRDISWSASKAFIWDAARINFPSGRKGIAMSVYPAESNSPAAYRRSVQYLKQSVEFYSKQYFEYPWNSAVVVAGVALGMEYPGIVFCSYSIHHDDLWHDITHEIGHNWFPMIVGSNERRFMWMDEGMCTFINGYSSNWFNHGEYADTSTRNILSMAKNMAKAKSPLMIPPEAMKEVGMYYYKTTVGLNILRNNVLGPERFDFAFNTYIQRWAYKHPQPDDFFRTMNDASGENLNWFWKEWFFETWVLDQSVKGVNYIKDNPQNGALITIENLGQIALPVKIAVKETNGNTSVIQLPVEVWQRGPEWTFRYPSTSALVSVVIDPETEYPDTDRGNNTWKAPE
jgi:Peptidase family M1 domain